MTTSTAFGCGSVLSLAFRSIGDSRQPKFAQPRLPGHLGNGEAGVGCRLATWLSRQEAARQFRDVLYQGKQPADCGGSEHVVGAS